MTVRQKKTPASVPAKGATTRRAKVRITVAESSELSIDEIQPWTDVRLERRLGKSTVDAKFSLRGLDPRGKPTVALYAYLRRPGGRATDLVVESAGVSLDELALWLDTIAELRESLPTAIVRHEEMERNVGAIRRAYRAALRG
jgi:hypothetical protein